MLRRFTCVWLFVILWTATHQPMRFSGQEYWSGWPCSTAGDLPAPGIEPASLTFPALAGGFFTTSTTDLTVIFYWVWPNFVCVISKILHTHMHMRRRKIYLKKNEIFIWFILCVFPVAQTVKNLPAMQETRVSSLDWEVPLENGMVIHSSILAWRIP